MGTGIFDLESNADSTCCKEQGDPSRIGEMPPFLELLCSRSPVRRLPSWRSVPPRKLTASMPKKKLEAIGDPCYKLLDETRTVKLRNQGSWCQGGRPWLQLSHSKHVGKAHSCKWRGLCFMPAASAIAMALCGMHMLRACLSLAFTPLCSTVLVVAECGDGTTFSWI